MSSSTSPGSNTAGSGRSELFSNVTWRLAPGERVVLSTLGFTAAATVLSATFDRPDILRKSAPVVLPAVVDGGTGLP